MSLTVGDRLGHYDVTALIGEGGMGQVYRATDTQLGRDVALKILPDAFAADPDRLARFQREAQVLASLNHPNIAQIHGIEKSEDTRALVLELVEGPTLADRIAQGPIPIDEALPIAKQIAEALEAAHEAGVIHRDLKPANIKVRADGTVKVLDFGLAKMLAADAPSQDLPAASTMTAIETRDGVILGTAAYMSPEQARGQPLDRRTDIWAFGCVLYEMLAGRGAFGGDTLSDTIANVLERQPPWEGLPARTPAVIRKLLRRCLDKDPRERLHDVADARLEITEARRAPAADTGEATALPTLRVWQRPVPLAAGVVALLVVAGVTIWNVARLELPPARPLTRSVITLPPGGSVRSIGLMRHVAMSPDGTRIVYGSGRGNMPRRLYVRALDQLDATPLRGAQGGSPFFSPDGEHVGFLDGQGLTLKRIPVQGGLAVTICEVEGLPLGMSWGPDDVIVFGTTSPSGLWQVAAGGGAPEPLTRVDSGAVNHAWPHMLPGGRAVLFTIITGASATGATSGSGATRPVASERAQIAVVDLSTGEHTVLVEEGTSPQYSPTGHIVYGLNGTLWAVDFNSDRLARTTTPMPVLEEVNTKASGAVNVGLSQDGSLVYLPGKVTDPYDRPHRFVWVDREGREEPVAAEARSYQDFSLSPNGAQVAVSVEGDVWMYDLTSGRGTRLTFGLGNVGFPRWTPDGRRVAFGPPLSWTAADGTGEPVVLMDRSAPNAFTRDAAALIFREAGEGQFSGLGMLSLGGDRASKTWAEPSGSNADVSPDGRFIA